LQLGGAQAPKRLGVGECKKIAHWSKAPATKG
jgi:hypothetical protein